MLELIHKAVDRHAPGLHPSQRYTSTSDSSPEPYSDAAGPYQDTDVFKRHESASEQHDTSEVLKKSDPTSDSSERRDGSPLEHLDTSDQ